MVATSVSPPDRQAPPRASVLVVDDEPTIAEVVCRYLELAGFATRTAADGEEALRSAADHPPDLVVLDLMLPGVGGLDVLRRLPAGPAGRRPAVILLTARGDEAARVAGLGAGADDYVAKPFSPAELVARVQAVLRRTSPAPDAVLRLGELEIDTAAHVVRVAGREVALTHREYDLLHFLARSPGRAFTREELMEAVWRFSFYTDTSTVTVHVRRLRAKIEDDPSAPRRLRTAWGVGYRLDP